MPEIIISGKMSIKKLISKCYYDSSTKKTILTDCEFILKQYPSLRPKETPFVIRDKMVNCFCLDGTLPVDFRGKKYHIPIRLIYFNSYPNVPPRVSVIPTSEMMIKTSKYVRDDGLIITDTLLNWQPNFNILLILQELPVLFSTYMPLFKKSSESNPVPVQRPPEPSVQAKKLPSQEHIEKVYSDLFSNLSMEISELEKDTVQIERKEEEVHIALTEQFNSGGIIIDKSSQLQSAIDKIETWIENHQYLDEDQLDLQDLVYFQDPKDKDRSMLQADLFAYDSAASCIMTAFNKGTINCKDMVKGLREVYRAQFLAGRLLDKYD